MNITELKALAEKATPGPMEGVLNRHLIEIPVRATDLEKAGISLAYIITDSPHRREVAQANARLFSCARSAILELIAQLEDAQGEIRALRATEAGVLDRLAKVEAEHAALLKAISDAEPVAWQYRKPIVNASGEIVRYSPWINGEAPTMLWPHRPLYTLNGIKP